MKKLTAAARAAFEAIRSDAPDDHFYFFALYTTEDGGYVCATAWSEEALARAVGTGRDAAARKRALRFSAPDSPFHEAHSDGFEGLPSGKKLHDACFDALRELDGEGLFGKGMTRSRALLNVVYGDMSDEKWLEHANRLNSRAAVARALPFLNLHEAGGSRGRIEAWGAPAYQLSSLSLSADRTRVAYCGSGGEVGILDVATRTPLFEKKRKGEHWASVLAPDGACLYLGDVEGILALGVDGKAQSLTKSGPSSTMVISPDGTRLAVASHSAPLRMFESTRTTLRELWKHGPKAPATLAISPDGRSLAVGTRTGVQCFDVESGEELWSLALSDAYTVRLVWGPGEGQLYVSSSQWVRVGQDPNGAGVLAVHDGETGILRRTLPWRLPVDALAVSPSGRRIALASSRVLFVLDAQEGTELAHGKGTQESLTECVFVSDDVVLANGRDVNRGPALLSLTLI